MQYAPPILAGDLVSRTALLKHWLFLLLDRGKRFTTGMHRCPVVSVYLERLPGFPSTFQTHFLPAAQRLTEALSRQTHLAPLFAGLQPHEVRLSSAHGSVGLQQLCMKLILQVCWEAASTGDCCT